MDPDLPLPPGLARHTHPCRDPLTLGGHAGKAKKTVTSRHPPSLVAGAARPPRSRPYSPLLLILEVTPV